MKIVLPISGNTSTAVNFVANQYYVVSGETVTGTTQFSPNDTLDLCVGSSTNKIFLSRASTINYIPFTSTVTDPGSCPVMAIHTLNRGSYQFENVYGICIDLGTAGQVPYDNKISIPGNFSYIYKADYYYSLKMSDYGINSGAYDMLFVEPINFYFVLVKCDNFNPSQAIDWNYSCNVSAVRNNYTRFDWTNERETIQVSNSYSVLSIRTSGARTQFYVKDAFEFGGTVFARCRRPGSSFEVEIDVTPYATFSGYNMNISGQQAVTVQCFGSTSTYNINVKKKLTNISVSGQKVSFKRNDQFSFGGTVTAYWSDNTTSNVTSSSTFTGYNMSQVGRQTVTVSYTYDNVTESCIYSILVNGITNQITCNDGYDSWKYGDGIFSNMRTTYEHDGKSYYRYSNGYSYIYVSVDNPYASNSEIYTWNSNGRWNGEGIGMWQSINEVGAWTIPTPLFDIPDHDASINDIERMSNTIQRSLRDNVENSDTRCPTYQQIITYGNSIKLVSSPHLTYTSNALVRWDDLEKLVIRTICDVQFTSAAPKDSVSNKSVTITGDGEYVAAYNCLHKKGTGTNGSAQFNYSNTPLSSFLNTYNGETFRITLEFMYPTTDTTNIASDNLVFFRFMNDSTSYYINLANWSMGGMITKSNTDVYKLTIEGSAADALPNVNLYRGENLIFHATSGTWATLSNFITRGAPLNTIMFLPGLYSAQNSSRHYMRGFKVEVLE